MFLFPLGVLVLGLLGLRAFQVRVYFPDSLGVV